MGGGCIFSVLIWEAGNPFGAAVLPFGPAVLVSGVALPDLAVLGYEPLEVATVLGFAGFAAFWGSLCAVSGDRLLGARELLFCRRGLSFCCRGLSFCCRDLVLRRGIDREIRGFGDICIG